MEALDDRHRTFLVVDLIQGPILDGQIDLEGPIDQRAGVVERAVLDDADEVGDGLAADALGEHFRESWPDLAQGSPGFRPAHSISRSIQASSRCRRLRPRGPWRS